MSHIKPNHIRFVMMPLLNADNTMDGENPDGWECSHEMESLVEKAVEYAEEHGGETFVYECRPVRRVLRGKTKVIKLKG